MSTTLIGRNTFPSYNTTTFVAKEVLGSISRWAKHKFESTLIKHKRGQFVISHHLINFLLGYKFTSK